MTEWYDEYEVWSKEVEKLGGQPTKHEYVKFPNNTKAYWTNGWHWIKSKKKNVVS